MVHLQHSASTQLDRFQSFKEANDGLTFNLPLG